MPSQNEQTKQEYEDLETLKKQFDFEYQKAAETKDFTKVIELKSKLEQKVDILQKNLWPFENLPEQELRKSYDVQKETLERVGILEELSSGEAGIKGIDKKEYTFPSYQEIIKKMRENNKMLKIKQEQGFNKLLIVPFGMKLDDLIEKYKQVILKHHKEGKLFATKEKLSDPDELLEMDTKNPIYIWEKYINADTSGELMYFPKEFSSNHQGKTKQEILKVKGGFNVLFIEDLPIIPQQDKGKEIKGRKQLETGKTPNQYLEIFNPLVNSEQVNLYQNETGMTPEEQITYAINYLEDTNQVVDDFRGKGSASYQVGAYFAAVSGVPSYRWCCSILCAILDSEDPEHFSPRNGVRSVVRVD